MMLEDSRYERYSRQMLFQPIGLDGQDKLMNSRVLIVGLGALGAVLANHIVRSGVGHVRLVDRDYVERSNLHRQMLFDEDDAAAAYPKAVAAELKLTRMNRDISIEAIVADVTAHNVESLLQGIDVVLDGTDNFQTRLLLNDACFKAGIPLIYGGAVASNGMTAVFIPNRTCCLRCLLGSTDSGGPTCDTVGVIGPIIHIIASYQAVEALKWLVGATDVLRGSLLSIDLWRHQVYEMQLPQAKPDCPTCGERQYPSLQVTGRTVETLCGRDTVQIDSGRKLILTELEQRLSPAARTLRNPFLLKAYLVEGEALVMFADGRVLVQGTEDIVRARTLFDRYIGS